MIIYYVYLIHHYGGHSLVDLCYKEETAKWWINKWKGPGEMTYQPVWVRDYEPYPKEKEDE